MWETDIGLHGWIALALTIVGVTGLNLWLMHLARRRWDHGFERIETAEPEEADGEAAHRAAAPGREG
jgi:hypothetical protein